MARLSLGQERSGDRAKMREMSAFWPAGCDCRPATPWRPRSPVVVVVAGLLLGSFSTPSLAQSGGRRVATLETLSAHPVFFHGQEVIVHADVVGEGVLAYLVGDGTRLLTLDVPPPPEGTTERLEIIGVYYDIGRFEPDDPRVSDQPFELLSESLLNKPWPNAGELPVLVASSARPTDEPRGTTLRTVTLDPDRFVDEGVTVIGRFRGRNLYGDLPMSPSESRWDFVLVSADAALWVVGKEPKGDGFELDVQARIDTGHWLEVTGTVRLDSGMVLIDAGAIALADPADRPERIVAVETRRGPAPEVIFSAPLPDDTDVPRDSSVRIQFSRDMDPASFEGRVRVRYQPPQSPDPADPNLQVDSFEIEYRGRNRVLEIRFNEELERFRTLTVELQDGIAASDGAALQPWTLSFFVSG